VLCGRWEAGWVGGGERPVASGWVGSRREAGGGGVGGRGEWEARVSLARKGAFILSSTGTAG
jgi:hypothetical protein